MSDFSFYCKPAPGERIETAFSITSDTSSAIHGVVTDQDGAALVSVLVLLFRIEDDAPPVLIAQCTTDRDGHFAFGGLLGDVLYRVKVFEQNKRVRELTLASSDLPHGHHDPL